MALILAIESDKRQVNSLTAIVRGKLRAELVLGDSAESALERLGDRVPDLILTSALLSPRDEQTLSDRLRRLNGVATHVQTLTLPLFASPSRQGGSRGGMLSALLGDRDEPAAPDGCDPSVFAEQCKEYLQRTADEREVRHHQKAAAIQPQTVPAETVPEATVPEEPSLKVECDEEQPATVDVDLAELFGQVEASSAPAANDAADDEPAVYELSAETIDLAFGTTPVETVAAPIAVEPLPAEPAAAEPAPAEPAATAAAAVAAAIAAVKQDGNVPEPVDHDFDDWQKVIDALKRESAQVRMPKERKPEQRAEIAAPVAAAPVETPKGPVEPPRRRLRAAPDEWNMFDPAQIGMNAVYERLKQLKRDDERH